MASAILMLLCASCANSELERTIRLQKSKLEGFEMKLNSLEYKLQLSKDTITALRNELYHYQLDPAKLFSQANESYVSKDTTLLVSIFDELAKYHKEREETKKVKKMVEALRAEYQAKEKARLAKEKAQQLAEERRRILEEQKHPHTASGLAKKAAHGSTIVGIWQMSPDACVTIIKRKGSYYMYILFPYISSIDSPDRLLSLGNGTYKYAEEETGETFVVRPDGLYAYAYGVLSNVWSPIW